MANTHRCGCNRRNSNNMGCLSSMNGCRRWEGFPYYRGCCPNAEGEYDCQENGGGSGGDDGERRCGRCCDCECRRRRHRDRCDRCDRYEQYERVGQSVFGLFSACQPMAVAAQGVVPLAKGSCGCQGFGVNGGRISLRESGVYLATMTVQVPENTGVESVFSLNVDDVSQPSASIPVTAEGGAFSATAQAIFEADEGDAVFVESSETVNVTDPALQPMVTLTLMRLD